MLQTVLYGLFITNLWMWKLKIQLVLIVILAEQKNDSLHYCVVVNLGCPIHRSHQHLQLAAFEWSWSCTQ